MNKYPNDENTFHQLWSTEAGALAAFQECICEIDRRTGLAFIEKRDDTAQALRDLATVIKHWATNKTKIIDGYTEESKRRLRELQK